jgi:hypothetical protein
MEKNIKIDSKNSLKLNNNVGWLFIYKDQFGRDIVPTLVPVLNAGIDLVFGIYKETGGKFTKDSIMQIDTDALTDALIQATAIEATDLINITWALAKNADEDIPEPREWVRQFDTFPVDIIAPAVFELVFKSMVSTKNWKRLQSLRESLQPTSTSTN